MFAHHTRKSVDGHQPRHADNITYQQIEKDANTKTGKSANCWPPNTHPALTTQKTIQIPSEHCRILGRVTQDLPPKIPTQSNIAEFRPRATVVQNTSPNWQRRSYIKLTYNLLQQTFNLHYECLAYISQSPQPDSRQTSYSAQPVSYRTVIGLIGDISVSHRYRDRYTGRPHNRYTVPLHWHTLDTSSSSNG